MILLQYWNWDWYITILSLSSKIQLKWLTALTKVRLAFGWELLRQERNILRAEEDLGWSLSAGSSASTDRSSNSWKLGFLFRKIQIFVLKIIIDTSWLASVGSYRKFHSTPPAVPVSVYKSPSCGLSASLSASLCLTNPRTNDFHPPQSWSSQPSARPEQWFSFHCTKSSCSQVISDHWEQLESETRWWCVMVGGSFSWDSFLFLSGPNIFLQNKASWKCPGEIPK